MRTYSSLNSRGHSRNNRALIRKSLGNNKTAKAICGPAETTATTAEVVTAGTVEARTRAALAKQEIKIYVFAG
jgi:hypothetical protein